MGCVHHDTGLPFAVFSPTPPNKTGHFYHGERPSPCRSTAGRAIFPSGEEGHTAGEPGTSPGRVFLPLLPGTQAGWRASSYSGPQGAQQVSSPPEMQDADDPQGEAGHLCGRLVCHHRPQGCLLPDSHMAGALAFPEVRLRGQGLRVSGPAFRHFPGSTYVHPMHGRSSGTPEEAGTKGPQLPRRLAGLRRVRGAMPQSCGPALGARPGPGVKPQLREEQAPAVPGNSIPWHSPGLQDGNHRAVTEEAARLQGLPQSVPAAFPGQLGALPSPPGFDGGHGASSPAGSAAHETCPTVPVEPGLMSPEVPPLRGGGFPETSYSPSLVESFGQHTERECPGTSGLSPSGLHRCIPGRLGRCPRGLGGQWALDRALDNPAHKCPGVESRPPCTSTVSAETERPPCHRQDRQHGGSGLHQQAGGPGFTHHVQAGNPTAEMGPPSLPLTQSSTCAGVIEYGRGHHVERGPMSGRMEAPSTGGRTDLGPPRQGRVRPVRLQRVITLSTLLLSEERQSTSGVGCSGSPMAPEAALCLPSLHPPPASPPKATGGGGKADSGGSFLAPHAMVLSDPTTLGRHAMGTPTAQGPAVSGERDPVPPLPSGAQVGGLAPERDRLLALGLPVPVVRTIQEARAPSTRMAYSYRWEGFSTWCGTHRVDPYSATAQDILLFLQGQLDAGKSAVTLRGMVAAIKAVRCGEHALNEASCSLISRFLKGARRLTVHGTRPTIPPWDLEVVLNALRRPPFEPLGAAGLKWLSLKTAFLLAITSARRVSELQALSVHSDCCRFSPDGSSVVLRPNPAFLPKVFSEFHLSQSVELRSLPPSGGDGETEQQSVLCPVRALTEYIRRTQAARKTDQLFVCFDAGRRGRPLSKPRLSHWVVDTIQQAYVLSGAPVPPGVRAHSTRGVATSWALWRGASLATICATATWSSQSTFSRFYRLNVATSPSFGERVLGGAC